MTEPVTTELLFERAYLLIAEGHIENALATLDGIPAENEEQRREVAYLRAWCSMLGGRWDEAAQFVLPQEISGETVADIQELGRTERRRRPYYLLVMGDVAANLWRYEQAIQHYNQCIKLLDERRMNDLNRRIRALLGLGLCHLRTGYPANALEYYQQALRLCGNDTRQPNLPHVYYGLSDTYRHLNDLERALDYGKRALNLYRERGDRHYVGRIRSLLGDIYRQMGNLPIANESYTEALALAMGTESIGAIFNCLTTLAEMRLQENKPEDAWRYCEMALDYSPKVPRPYFLGKMYIVCGKVKEAQAKEAAGQEAQRNVEQAISYYQQAVETLKRTDARPELAEAYSLLAHLQEESGRQDQAIATWKSAYAVRAGLEDAPLV